MAEFPAFPIWTDAYFGDTTHLSTIEHGAYLLLLMTMWRTSSKSLPADDKRLAKYVGCTPSQWARMRPVIMEFFDEKDGQITQGRLTDEANAVKQKSNRQSDKAKSRWLKQKGSADAVAMPRDCQDDASLTLTHIQSIPPPLDPTSARASFALVAVADHPADPSFRERLLAAMGHETTDPRVGTPKDMEIATSWQEGIGLDEATIVAVISDVIATKKGGPPSCFGYFTKAMERHATALKANPLAPVAASPQAPAKRGWAPPKPFKITPPRDKRETPEGMRAIEAIVEELNQKAAKGTKR